MASDEYASVGGGGALKLKGAKVKKHKKKKDKGSAAGLEKALGGVQGGPSSADEDRALTKHDDADEDDAGVAKSRHDDEEVEDDQPGESRKTEAERRFEEVKRKKLLELSKSASSRPELLKTHKQRVEELNTYLSKLSEHHDMPKIGPG